MQAAKRVILNTGFLYGKMVISIFIALYSTRIVLNALGVEDFGIFNLVAGVIAMLSFLNAAMTVSTQRYMSFYLGAGEAHKLDAVFRTSVFLHLVIGVLIVVSLEIAGIFLFNGFLNIPSERITTAKIVYHFMVVSTFFTINAVPYDAAINAHENMLVDALTGVFESIMKLGIAVSLIFYLNDRLILYALLMAGLTILIRIIKSVYCLKQYNECKVKIKGGFDFPLLKEMFSFAGWNLFGALCGLGRGQGLAIILNLFFGTVVNAAFGIANQVSGQLNAFSVNMLKALNPQIIKSEGANDRNRMLRLSMMASKYSSFLLAFFAIPLIFEMPYVLKLWLKTVPDYTVIFCQLILVGTMTSQLTVGLQTAIQSTGKIKMYQSVVGSLLLLNLPISYFLLKFGFPAYSALISFIGIEVLAVAFRIIFLHRIAGLSVLDYLQKVILKIGSSISLPILICFIPFRFMEEGFLRLVILSLCFGAVYLVCIYLLGMNQDEKANVLQIKIKLKQKFC